MDRYKDVKRIPKRRRKKPEPKLDILDDPADVFEAMGQVPLLTREQEVEISKRIRGSRRRVADHIHRLGLSRAHTRVGARWLKAGTLRSSHPRQEIESRERYMKLLPRLCKKVQKMSGELGANTNISRAQVSATLPN